MIQYCKEYWDDVDKVLKQVPNINKLKGCSIFITGGTGLIGSSVVELLLRYNQCCDANVRIILGGRSKEKICKRFPDFYNEKDFYYIPYDATANEKLDIHADYMIHGASNANPATFTTEPVETILANIIGLNTLLAAASEQDTKRVLYISSSEVYGNKEETRQYQEDDYGYVDILNARSGYPCSKRAAESLCIAYEQEYHLDTVIARPGHIYGPSITDTDDRASAQFTRNAANGEDILMKSAGKQLRSYCYTLDCASAILTILLNGETGNAYNISNKNSIVTINDVAKALAKTVGKQVVYKDATEEENRGYNMMSNSSLNATKLEKLGWKAVFNLDEGAERTISFYKNVL